MSLILEGKIMTKKLSTRKLNSSYNKCFKIEFRLPPPLFSSNNKTQIIIKINTLY